MLGLVACSSAPPQDQDQDGFTVEEGDCDDTNAEVSPEGSEGAGWPAATPDGLDNDCNGVTDDGTSAYDDDGDGLSEGQGDCDDLRPTVGPGQPEVCDGLDNDCDGLGIASEEDADQDGYRLCHRDCDDSSPEVHPGASELDGDGLDSNCDGRNDPLSVGPESASFVALGPAPLLLYGTSISDCGDEQVGPVAIGAPGLDEPVAGGRAFLYATELDLVNQSPTATILGPDGFQQLGEAVQVVGDINGDGASDYLVSAPEFVDESESESVPQAGRAYLFHGPVQGSLDVDLADATLRSTRFARRLGARQSVPRAGDLDGDGVPDLVLGGPDVSFDGPDGGEAFIVRSSPTGLVAIEDERLYFGEAGDRFGESIDAGIDITGDGIPDLVASASAPLVDGARGQVWVIPGPIVEGGNVDGLGFRISGDEVDARFGQSLAIVPDVSGDGVADLLVGASGADGGRGLAFLFHGPIGRDLSTTDAAATLVPGDGVCLFGAALEGLGDINGDGFGDLVVGAALSSAGAGSVHVFFGPLLGEVPTDAAAVTLEGDAPGQRFGLALARGCTPGRLLVGAPRAAWGGVAAGAVLGFDWDALLD